MTQSVSINRSGTTPYRILVHQEADTLRVKLIGQWGYRDSAAFWNMVLRESEAGRLKRVLVMFQLSEPLSIKQAHELARSAGTVFANKGIRMAVVDSNKRSFLNSQFWQMTSCTALCRRLTSCTVSCSQLFTQTKDAEQWLMGN